MLLRHYHIPIANASTPHNAEPEGPWDSDFVEPALKAPPRREGSPLQVTAHSSQKTLFDAYLFLTQVPLPRRPFKLRTSASEVAP